MSVQLFGCLFDFARRQLQKTFRINRIFLLFIEFPISWKNKSYWSEVLKAGEAYLLIKEKVFIQKNISWKIFFSMRNFWNHDGNHFLNYSNEQVGKKNKNLQTPTHIATLPRIIFPRKPACRLFLRRHFMPALMRNVLQKSKRFKINFKIFRLWKYFFLKKYCSLLWFNNLNGEL